MSIRLFFAKNDCSPENFTFDEGRETTLYFFPSGKDGQIKTFTSYGYIKIDNNIRIFKLGDIHLFFKENIDYDLELSGEYQYLIDLEFRPDFLSLGASLNYYAFLKKIKEHRVLTALNDIISSKDCLDKVNEYCKQVEFSENKLSDIAVFLLKVSYIIFKYDDTTNYLMISESDKLYKNKDFAKEYKKIYEEFFDKINSPYAALEFLDFLQKYISDGEGEYSDFEGIIKKIKEKYKHERIQKKLLKIYEPASKAYKMIDEIKEILKVKKEFFQDTKNCLGHYTSMSTLKILLENQKNQKFILEDSLNIENAREESTVNCLRLTNSRLMNDPLEGKVITNFLDSSYNQKDFLPSSIYMMCITPNVDNLPMWQQYGVNGTGAFIRLKNEFLEKIVSDSEADIYRVCYLSSNNEVNVSHMDKNEASLLEEKLGELKRICEDLKIREEDKYLEILASIKQDISFLFKTADYSYEAEYRIVLFVSDELKLKVKCEMNKDYPFPFIYIYLDDIEYDKSKYSEVIIGPKAIDVDFLGPYINYLDPEIDISVSKIPYR